MRSNKETLLHKVMENITIIRVKNDERFLRLKIM